VHLHGLAIRRPIQHGTGLDFLAELALSNRGNYATMTLQRECVQILAGYLPFLGHILGSQAPTTDNPCEAKLNWDRNAYSLTQPFLIDLILVCRIHSKEQPTQHYQEQSRIPPAGNDSNQI
jgi:hypothetical protein